MSLKLLSLHTYGTGYRSRYDYTLRAGRSGNRNPVATFSALIEAGPRIHPAPCKIGIGLFPGLKRSSRVVDHLSRFNAKDKERVELYVYLPTVLSWQVIGLTLTFKHSWAKFDEYETIS